MSDQAAILVVDDDEDFRALTRMALEVRDYRVIEAESAYAALDVVQAEPDAIVLVLADYKMPGMTGAELVEKLAEAVPRLGVHLWSSFPELAPGVMRKSLAALDTVLAEQRVS